MKSRDEFFIILFVVIAFSFIFLFQSVDYGILFMIEFSAGASGVFLAFYIERQREQAKKQEDKEDLLRDLHTELKEISAKLTGKGILHFPDIWESAVSSGQLRLLDSEQVRNLASIYHDVKANEYEATRTRDLAEEISLTKAKGQDEHLDNLTVLWGRYSVRLRDVEKKLSMKIEELLKKDWWNIE